MLRGGTAGKIQSLGKLAGTLSMGLFLQDEPGFGRRLVYPEGPRLQVCDLGTE